MTLFENPYIVALLTIVVLWLAYPKKACSKKSDGKGFFATLWSGVKAIFSFFKPIVQFIVTLPYTVAVWVTSFATSKTNIQQLVGGIFTVLVYIGLAFWMRDNFQWFAKLLNWISGLWP